MFIVWCVYSRLCECAYAMYQKTIFRVEWKNCFEQKSYYFFQYIEDDDDDDEEYGEVE
jgi:hypothetical protein